MKIEKHIKKLGMQCSDKVTGFNGVITSVSFDIAGCIQAVVTPPAKDGKTGESQWFDMGRLTIHGIDDYVMRAPDFNQGYIADAKKGPTAKPSMARPVKR